MYYVKLKDLEERTRFIDYLKDRGMLSVFHYVPLHSSIAGRKYGVFKGRDRYTTVESERLVRLPIYYGIKEEEIEMVVSRIEEFFSYSRLEPGKVEGIIH